MQHFQRILVGVDLALDGEALTPGSMRAARQARWLAESSGATLTFLHSVWADIHEEGQSIRPGPGKHGMEALESLAEEATAAGARAELVIVRDRAWLEIIRRVQRRDNDLVVVARRNQLDPGAIGGIARKLMRKCPCPVWVVKLEGSLEPRAIVAATDLSEVGNLAVVLAADLARISGCELHVVHAWQAPIVVPISSELEGTPLAPSELEELQKAAEERLESALRALDVPVAVMKHVPCEAPSRAIRELVERIPADLLVMGTVSRGGIAGLLMGNTAERLLDRVHCSMLTVKPSDFVSPVK